MEEVFTLVVATLAATLRVATPLVLCAMGGLFSEKSGIIDVGLEGKMLMAAFFAAATASLTASAWAGVGAAILAEGPEFVLQEVAISAYDTEGRAVTIPPCGGCRQRLLEFGSAVQVHFATAEGGVRSLALGVLLPESFRMGEDG